jgi:23S rRNA (pseudouridine1915-N3)-methyltransferase
MQINIFSVGKWQGFTQEKEIFARYLERMNWKIKLFEFKNNDDLQKNFNKEHYNIALDLHGKNYTSEEFANNISKLQLASYKQVTFIIGGSEGIEESIRKQANELIAFGKVTWPHIFVRVMLAEQIYRAYTINSNHPYHK